MVRKIVGVGLCGALLASMIAGCPQREPVENAVTFGLKAAQGRLTETTPNEWIAVAEKVDARIPEADIELTEEQAQAGIDFLEANDLNTIQEVVQLVGDVQADPTLIEELEVPESLLEIFAAEFEGEFGDDFDIDAFVDDIQEARAG